MGRGVACDKEDARGCETGRPVIYTPPTRVCFKSFAPDGPVPLVTIDPACPPLHQASASPPCSRPWPHWDASMFAIVDGRSCLPIGVEPWCKKQKVKPKERARIISVTLCRSGFSWAPGTCGVHHGHPSTCFGALRCSGDDIRYILVVRAGGGTVSHVFFFFG